MLSELFNPNSRRSLLIEINPHQILAAGIVRQDRGATIVDCAAEFDRADDAGLRRWLDTNFEKQKMWIPTVCGFAHSTTLLRRESIQPRKLSEPGYLANLAQELYKVEHPERWKLHALSPVEGTPTAPEGAARPALIYGVADTEVHQLQQRLLQLKLMPYRMEPGLLPLFGAIFDYKSRRNDKRAVVVVVLGQEQTTAYILGKEGVQTPGPVQHGLSSIMQAARKEFNLGDDAAVMERLRDIDDELLLRASKFVRAIGRDLKPLVDSYELTTGQPVGEIYCAYLPPSLRWIGEALARVAERSAFDMDFAAWLPTVNLQAAPGVPEFGSHWLGALGAVAEIPGAKMEASSGADTPYSGPWHLDCRIATDLPSTKLVGRRFLAGTIAGTLLAFTLMITLWQLYISYSLEADTTYWEQQMAQNKTLFDDLNQSTKKLTAGAVRIDRAYDLMGAPYQVSDFILNLGRTLPPHMRVDRIEANDTRISLSGGLREPSEEASRTLGRYLDELRRNPAIGPLFSSISLTSLQREGASEDLAFEISFKLKTAAP